MATNDEGEFELILGNKQLLSVFFIVVVLLGIFFTMGYIVGRNTAGVEMAAADRPLVVDSPGSEAAPPPPVETASAKPAPPEAEPPKPAPQQAVAPPPAPPTPTPAKPKPAPAQPKPAPAAAPGEPTEGVYLQVVATTRPEAEVFLNVLEKRGFRGRLAPVPGQDIYRVLIGPSSGPDDLSATREKLRAAGFQPFTRRY